MDVHQRRMKRKIADRKIVICNGYCVYDHDVNLCTGCGLTLEEISAWPGLAIKEKKNIAGYAQKRLAQFYEKK